MYIFLRKPFTFLCTASSARDRRVTPLDYVSTRPYGRCVILYQSETVIDKRVKEDDAKGIKEAYDNDRSF